MLSDDINIFARLLIQHVSAPYIISRSSFIFHFFSVGHFLCQQLIESPCVVMMDQMAKLVQHHIFNADAWGTNQSGIQQNLAGGGAAAPTGGHVL